MSDNEETEIGLSSVGWAVIEIAERMIRFNFSAGDICDALDLPSEDHLKYLLARGQQERAKLEADLLGEMPS